MTRRIALIIIDVVIARIPRPPVQAQHVRIVVDQPKALELQTPSVLVPSTLLLFLVVGFVFFLRHRVQTLQSRPVGIALELDDRAGVLFLAVRILVPSAGELDAESLLVGVVCLEARDFRLFGAVADGVEADDGEGMFGFGAVGGVFVFEAAD